MEQTAFQARYEEYVAEIEKTLASQFMAQQPYGKLYESMRYSLLSGAFGKKAQNIRLAQKLVGGDWKIDLKQVEESFEEETSDFAEEK
ncbi:MAG: hypothetical protein IKD11_02875, partial [Oscillospiraceae bacterium]|nr:hypothetical protein [Oscillospiraceae bacterium]